MKIFKRKIIPGIIMQVLLFIIILPGVYSDELIAEVLSNHKDKTQHEDKCFTESKGNKVCIGHPTSSDIHFVINFRNKTIKARARLTFKTITKSVKVFFFLDPFVKKAILNKRKINVESRKAPGNENRIIVIPIQAEKKDNNLELEYEITGLTRWGLNWAPFWWLTDFSDSTDARFINAFAPASFEKDRYPMTYSFEFNELKNNLNLYTSASEITKIKTNIYKLKFADWNNMASPYFEFTTRQYRSYTFNYRGRYQAIPVKLYLEPSLGKEKGITFQFLVNDTENIIRKTLDKFETTMGQYPFDKLLVKLYSLQEGDLPLEQEYSMEFGGAIVSRLELIPHEICHQWFGRGASPRDGQAGFVDELICDWYDYDNPVKAPIKLRKPSLLSSPDSFTLRTPEQSYQEGLFLAEIAYLYKQHNIDIYEILKEFYQKFRLSDYDREDFIKHLGQHYRGDLSQYFQRHIYGK